MMLVVDHGGVVMGTVVVVMAHACGKMSYGFSSCETSVGSTTCEGTDS